MPGVDYRGERATHRGISDVISHNDAAAVDRKHVSLLTRDSLLVAAQSSDHPSFIHRCRRWEVELIDEASNPFRFIAPTRATENAQFARGPHAERDSFAVDEPVIRGLYGVTQGVTEVEKRTDPRFALVSPDDGGLQRDVPPNDVGGDGFFER
jgi:hypothetical protein